MMVGIKTFILATILALLNSCGKDPESSPQGPGRGGDNTGETTVLSLTPFQKLNQRQDGINSHADDSGLSVIKMDWRSYQELGPANNVVHPTYSRIRTLKDGSYILGWHNTRSESDANGSDTFYALSKDFKTWTYMGYLWQHYDVYNKKGKPDVRLFTNPNFLQLSNGEILAVAAFRTSSTYNSLDCRDEQGLIVKRSGDGGKTWFGETEIYHGPCWEAHLMELPSGEIQVFFSESRPWISNSHSGTDMVCSTDGGVTWSPALGSDAYRVMRKHWWNVRPSNTSYGPMNSYTYQMPVGIILNNSSRFAFAMESANQRSGSDNKSTQFSIAIVFSHEDGTWDHLTGDEVTPKEYRLDSVVVRGAAPYLIQFPSGETVLAYGGTDSKQHFRIGNATATKFGDDVVALPDKGSWGGLDLTDTHTFISAMRDSRDGYEAATIALAKFHLDHTITASTHKVSVDAKNSDWTVEDDALFVGAKCQAQATLRCAADKDNYYFLVEVLDRNLSSSDFGYILLSPDDGTAKTGAKCRRVRFGINGLKSTDQYGGGWKEMDFGARVAAAYDGTPKDNSDTDNGFLAEISVPRSAVEAVNGRIRVNLGYFDASSNVEDVIADANNPSLWIPVKGL